MASDWQMIFIRAFNDFLRLAIILSLSVSIIVSGTFTINCPEGIITFARRPSTGLSPEYHPPPEVIQVHESPPSECFSRCTGDPTCSGYFVDYSKSTCIVVRNASLEKLNLVPTDESSYHWKMCLPGRTTGCQSHEWAFDVLPSVQLFRYEDKDLHEVTSVEQCIARCYSESTFTCRSARYEPSTQHCILSRHDRRTAPEVFRKSQLSVVQTDISYLERQCVPEPNGCQFRARGQRSKSSFQRQHVQVIEGVHKREDCEAVCLESAPFSCRTYQFFPNDVNGGPACLLSPEDYRNNDPLVAVPVLSENQQYTNGSSVFEKESCVETEVHCGPTAMSASVRVSTPFRGRIYALGHPYDCYSVSVSPGGRLHLDMPLHGRRCGTKNLGNGTFVNSVVVQHHPFVLRTSDRRIEVACDYHQLRRVKIRGEKGVRNNDNDDEGQLRPLSQHTVTAVAPTPPIRLRVVNASDQDVVGAELGDPLFLKVELADDSVYGIFGSGLVARSSGGSETVLLIDDNGCPVEPTVISSLEKLPGSKSLVAPFQAFKFASDAAVKFQMTVSYCLDACPPADCEAPTNRQSSYGKRRKRRAAAKFLELHPGDIVYDVQAETSFLLVRSLKPSEGTDGDQSHRLVQPELYLKPAEGLTPILTLSGDLCVSSTTMYLTAIAAGMVQLAIVGACASLFLCSGRKTCHPLWSSAWNGRSKLVTNQAYS